MESVDEQHRWQAFIDATLTRFGANISRIEIGTTINRKRWAGYTMQGFLRAWEIAFIAAKQHNIPLAGPNVTDFEPIYNIGVLSMLQAKKQLPDVHTNNLFSERVAEPERFDHRIFKYRWATALKFNLNPVVSSGLTGLMSIFLPCGHLYTFALGATATGSAVRGAAMMFAFWLGTLPALGFGVHILKRNLVRLGPARYRIAALILVTTGLLSLGNFAAELYKSSSSESPKPLHESHSHSHSH